MDDLQKELLSLEHGEDTVGSGDELPEDLEVLQFSDDAFFQEAGPFPETPLEAPADGVAASDAPRPEVALPQAAAQPQAVERPAPAEAAAPQGSQGFEARIVRYSLEKLEQGLNTFMASNFPFSFRVNTKFRFRRPERVALINEKIRLLEEFCNNGYPLQVQTLENMVRFLLAATETERAVQNAALGCRLHDAHAELHYLLALALYQSGRLEESLAETDLVRRIQPENDCNCYLAAVCNYKLGQEQEALDDIEAVFPAFRDSLAYLRFALLLFRKHGRAGMLEAVLRALMELQPRDRQWTEKLAVLLYRQDQFARAVPYLESLRAQQGERRSLHYMLGICYAYMNMDQAAVFSFRRLMQVDPSEGLELQAFLRRIHQAGIGDDKLRPLLGEYLLRENRVKECRTLCLREGEAGIKNRIALLLARCYLMGKDFRQAFAVLQEHPTDIEGLEPEFRYWQGYCLLRLGHLAEAAEHLRVAEERYFRPGIAAYYQGEIAAGQGRHQEAVQHFKRAVRFGKEDYETWLRMGDAALKADMLLTSGEAFRKAIACKPECEEAYNNLGIIYAREGGLEEAVHFFEKALLINPVNSEARFNLELARQKLQQAVHAE